MIEAVNGKDVSNYTNYPSENEVILCPGTRLRVVNDPLDQPPMHLIHSQEATDDNEEQMLTSPFFKCAVLFVTSNFFLGLLVQFYKDAYETDVSSTDDNSSFTKN